MEAAITDRLLFTFSGDGERPASLSSDVASFHGNNYWKRQSLEPTGSKKDESPMAHKLCQRLIEPA